jgi:hypothetical protein
MMNRSDCITERYSARTIGLVLLALGLALGAIGFLILPVVGFFFALPILGLSVLLLAAPHSKACRLITQKVNR